MQLFDGHEISLHQARFSGRFDVAEEEADRFRMDRVVVLIVAARSDGADFKVLDSGDVRRTATLKVDDARLLEGDMREQAIRYLFSGPDQGYIDMGIPRADVSRPIDEQDLSHPEAQTEVEVAAVDAQEENDLAIYAMESEHPVRIIPAGEAAFPVELPPEAARLLAETKARRVAARAEEASTSVASQQRGAPSPAPSRKDPYLEKLYNGEISF